MKKQCKATTKKKSHSKSELNSRAHRASRMHKFVALTYRIKCRAQFSISLSLTHPFAGSARDFLRFSNWLKRLYRSQLKRIQITDMQRTNEKKNEWRTKTNCQTNGVEEIPAKDEKINKSNHKTWFEWFQAENMNESFTRVFWMHFQCYFWTLLPHHSFGSFSNLKQFVL